MQPGIQEGRPHRLAEPALLEFADIPVKREPGPLALRKRP